MAAPHRAAVAGCALAALLPALAGCSTIGSGDGDPEGTVVLLTHDSFYLPEDVLDAFQAETGLTIDHRPQGDAGQLVTGLALSRDRPIGDVVFGIDNTFASRAVAEDVLEPYEARTPVPERFAYPGSDPVLTPIDYGDVCLNIDTRYFAERGIPEPASLDDLADPRYRDLAVVQNPATSSPGLAFLLATIEEHGEPGWQDYWTRLRDNGVLVVDGWTQAYTVEFSGSAGEGPRPIVVSYATSPPAEAGPDGAAPPTRALPETCFRQIEYAGIVAGTANEEAAGELIEFLLGPEVQEALPESMYVLPVVDGTPLPEAFDLHAPRPTDPMSMDPGRIGENRDEWISQWRDLMLG